MERNRDREGERESHSGREIERGRERGGKTLRGI